MVSRFNPTGSYYRIFERRARYLYREVIRRRLPHGVINWRYLRPGADERIRLHRRFWWQNRGHFPRLLWCVNETWLWLRWSLWSGWWASARAVRHFGPTVAAEVGMAPWRQFVHVLRLALAWSIHPAEVYRFRLYRQPHTVPDYVFGQETYAYHRWRSESLGWTQESLALLQDKVALAERLARIGIPVVSTVRSIARGSDSAPLAERMDGLDRVFCKGRSGNRGRNAFAAWRTADGLAGLRFEGQPLDDTRQVERAWRELLRIDDALIQPHLENHPALKPMIDGSEAITVRLISQWSGDAPACLGATLEIPAGRAPEGERTEYALLPLRLETGELQPVPAQVLLNPVARARAERLRLSAPTYRVPEWDPLVRDSLRAHSCLPDVRAIAWDWVVTPDGPILLEGNAGWGVMTPQIFHGGFLRAETRSSESEIESASGAS